MWLRVAKVQCVGRARAGRPLSGKSAGRESLKCGSDKGLGGTPGLQIKGITWEPAGGAGPTAAIAVPGLVRAR